MHISIDMPHVVNVHVDGILHSIVSTQTTLAGVLAEGSVTVNATDEVSADPQSRPTNGMTIYIVRVSSGEQARDRADSVHHDDDDRPDIACRHEESHAGRAQRHAYPHLPVSFADGVPTAKTLVSEQITVPAGAADHRHRHEAEAEAGRVKATNFTLAADSLNWAALARCESGGRANANDPPFYGLYQFRLGTWQAVGGTGLPSQASANEQTYRAQLLYKRSNWRTQWPVCGHYLFS